VGKLEDCGSTQLEKVVFYKIKYMTVLGRFLKRKDVKLIKEIEGYYNDHTRR
jgi:hypothetical protein